MHHTRTHTRTGFCSQQRTVGCPEAQSPLLTLLSSVHPIYLLVNESLHHTEYRHKPCTMNPVKRFCLQSNAMLYQEAKTTCKHPVSSQRLDEKRHHMKQKTCNSGAILIPLFIPHTQTITGMDALMSPHLEHSRLSLELAMRAAKAPP